MKVKQFHAGRQIILGGTFQCRVIDSRGRVIRELPPQHNLVMNGGINGTDGNQIKRSMGYCLAGTGTTADTVALDGTFAQSTTTITRSSGAGTFSSGDVGKWVKFGTGETAKITAYSNPTTVTVHRSQTVSATTLTTYNTARTALVAKVKSTATLDTTAGKNAVTYDDGAGSITFKRTYNFTAETGAITYTEVGIADGASSNIFSRILLDTPVAVDAEQQLQVTYSLTLTASNWVTADTGAQLTVTGWPYTYNVTGITHSGTAFTVTTSVPHHYVAGSKINLAGILPPTTAISSLTSTGTDFTVNTSGAHGLSPGDSIVIAGATPSGYNGTWTATTASGSTITVTSAINPGAGSGGTVRKSTPSPWFDGEWTVASVGTSTIVVTDSTLAGNTAGSAGTCMGNLKGTAQLCGRAFYVGNETGSNGDNSQYGGVCDPSAGISYPYAAYLFRVADQKSVPAYGTGIAVTNGNAATSQSKTAMDTGTHSWERTFVWRQDVSNYTDFTQLIISGTASANSALVFTFQERQRKDSGYELQLKYKVTLEPELV